MRNLLIAITLISSVCYGQSKKEQIEILETRVDSLKTSLSETKVNLEEANRTIDSNEETINNLELQYMDLGLKNDNLSQQNSILKEKNDELKIQVETAEKSVADANDTISALQDQIDQLNLRNEALSTQLTQEREKILILENEYSLTSDSVDILKQQIIELNRNNSLDAIRNSSEFETFLNYFLSTVYSEKNIDSLIYVSSPLIMDFVDQKIGFGRFYNMGAACNLYNSDDFGYNFYEDYFGETAPKTSNLSFFKNQNPEGGFCDEASSQNGIYYKNVSNLPEDWDMEKGESIPPPLKLKHLNKMVVQVQFDYWIAKTLYFVELNNKWFLLYINDCDCSA